MGAFGDRLGRGNETDTDRLADICGLTLELKKTSAKQLRLVSMVEINNIRVHIFTDIFFHCILLDKTLHIRHTKLPFNLETNDKFL